MTNHELSDLSYFGEKVNGLPDGHGKFVEEVPDLEDGSSSFCYRGFCGKGIAGVKGTFESGLLSGPVQIGYKDGSGIIAGFNR